MFCLHCVDGPFSEVVEVQQQVGLAQVPPVTELPSIGEIFDCTSLSMSPECAMVRAVLAATWVTQHSVITPFREREKHETTEVSTNL